MSASDSRPSDRPADAPPAPPEEQSILSLEQQRDLFLRIRLERARIPRRFRNKTLDNFEVRRGKDHKAIVQVARAFIDSFGRPGDLEKAPWAILYGTTGSGKTHVLCGILRELIARGHEALFYNVPNLFKDIRATFDGDKDIDEEDLLNEIIEAEILALDDLGAEKTTDWVLDRLYLVINQRYEAGRPILVTTNHDWPEDLDRAVGSRIASRLAEMCRVIGPFPKEDFRLKSAGLVRRLS